MLDLHEMFPIQHPVISIKFCLLDQDGPICSGILPWLWPEILWLFEKKKNQQIFKHCHILCLSDNSLIPCFRQMHNKISNLWYGILTDQTFKSIQKFFQRAKPFNTEVHLLIKYNCLPKYTMVCIEHYQCPQSMYGTSRGTQKTHWPNK